MKLLTLNVHAWLEVDQMRKLNQLIDTLYEEDYDVIAFQEINQMISDPVVEDETYQKPDYDPLMVPIKVSNFAYIIVSELRKRGLHYNWTWSASHIGYDIFDEGLAVLTKGNLKSNGYDISLKSDYTDIARRNCLILDTTIGEHTYTIVNTHLSWWFRDSVYYFKNEWNKLASYLPSSSDLIVVGDFNNDAAERQTGYDYILSQTPFLKDSYTAAHEVNGNYTMAGNIDGWSGTNSGKRIDYVFTHKNLIPKKHRVVFDGENGPVVSDHYGVEVTF